MYKKVLSPVFIASALAVSSSAALAANDGSIEITGRIVATTCNVEGQAPGGGAVKKSVGLDGISVAKLAAPGDVAGDKGFLIVVGGNDDCADGLKAKIRFDPSSPAMDRTAGRLNIDTAADAAKNVQIEIANGDGTPIHLFTGESRPVVIEGHRATIELLARYYSLGGATQGTANSRVGFQVVYD
ncbi:fimbrial protein [Dyella sp. 333MFSha]|uniref:fimbrial protein n=1 Tax=Dyella sp. 333MFSha TaxID=1798240 RepID=UPI000881D94B|nr:fimbrial protein [Dyella sp. 333MFSha]SDF97018.1 major type 1 subunit fimbrin (pilin) [Dyella sp. 333MFSha]